MTGTVAVPSGTSSLLVRVGDRGTVWAEGGTGFNGGGSSRYGGGGGGASDIRTSSALSSRMIVAAGGGYYANCGTYGEYRQSITLAGGAGGDAGSSGSAGAANAVCPEKAAKGGGAGMATGGGAGGTDGWPSWPGRPGALGEGGAGGTGFGGGGGGGWYGAGGGAGGNQGSSGGGGGGSSYVPAGGTDHGATSKPASVTFSYLAPEPGDGTPPVITPSVSPDPASTGWYNTATGDPTVSFAVSDGESSFDEEGCGPETVSADTSVEGRTITCRATSGGGTAEESVTVKRDATAPTVSFDAGGLTEGGSYVWGSTPAAPTCSASDTTSGVDQAGCSVTGYGTTVGTHTLAATATDNAGNTTTVTRRYSVAPWTTSGFYAPVDMGGVVNTVKGGSTVPVKFKVAAGSTPVIDPAKVGSFSASKVTCSSGAPTDSVEVTTTDATSLRYDATTGQFVYSWKTPRTPATCYQLTLTTADGTRTNALFNLK